MKIIIKPKHLILLGAAALLVLLFILAGVYSSFLGARYATGLKFNILGPDVIIAGDKANISWDSSPENFAAYPTEKIEVCKSKIYGRQCKTLASSVSNKGKATVTVPKNTPLGASYLRLTARSNKLLVPSRSSIRAIKVVSGVNLSPDDPLKITWKANTKYPYVIIQYCVPSNGKCYTISGRSQNSGSIDGLAIPAEAGSKKGYLRVRALDKNGKPVVASGKFVEFDATATEGEWPSKPKDSPKETPEPTAAPSAVDLKVFDYTEGKFIDGPVTLSKREPVLISWASTSVSSCLATSKLNGKTVTAENWKGTKKSASATEVVNNLQIGTHQLGIECFKTEEPSSTAAPDATDTVAINMGVSSNFVVTFSSPTASYTSTNNQLPVDAVVAYPSGLEIASVKWQIDGVLLKTTDWLDSKEPQQIASTSGISSAYTGTILLNRFGLGTHTLSMIVRSKSQLTAFGEVDFVNSSNTGATFVNPEQSGTYATNSPLNVKLKVDLDSGDSLVCQRWTLNGKQLKATDWSVLPAGFSKICPTTTTPTPTPGATGRASMISPVSGLRVLKNGYLPVTVVVWHDNKELPGNPTWQIDDQTIPSSNWLRAPSSVSVPSLVSTYVGTLKMSNYSAGNHTITFKIEESSGATIQATSNFNIWSYGSQSNLNIGGLNLPDGFPFIPNLPINISSILESIFSGSGTNLNLGGFNISVCACVNPASNDYGAYSCGGINCIPSTEEY